MSLYCPDECDGCARCIFNGETYTCSVDFNSCSMALRRYYSQKHGVCVEREEAEK